MDAVAISLIAFACIFGGTLFGMFLRTVLPEHHVNEDSKGAVMLGIGMIATLAALVLGLLTASAKGNFDTMSSELRQSGARIILLDRLMGQYGPETKATRDLLRLGIAETIKRVWPEDNIGQAVTASGSGQVVLETVQEQLCQLSPRTDAQRWLQSQALQVSSELAEGRWLLIEQLGQRTLPMPFFVMLVLWLILIFTSFGLFSPPNGTVIIVLLVCALSAAGSLFLIIELDTPYQGLIKVSSAPLTTALANLGK